MDIEVILMIIFFMSSPLLFGLIIYLKEEGKINKTVSTLLYILLLASPIFVVGLIWPSIFGLFAISYLIILAASFLIFWVIGYFRSR